jgi:predicted HNH restriction endonuclease
MSAKKSRKLPYTPNSAIRAALRRLFLRSRERASALKRDGYKCRCCTAKQSRAKGKEVYVEVHHQDGVLNWDLLFQLVREYLLCHPEKLETLCEKCHEKKEWVKEVMKLQGGVA